MSSFISGAAILFSDQRRLIHNAYHCVLVHNVLLSSGHKFVPSNVDTVRWNMMTGSNGNVTDFEGQVTACDTWLLLWQARLNTQHIHVWRHVQSGFLLIKLPTCLLCTMFSSHMEYLTKNLRLSWLTSKPSHLTNDGNEDSFSLRVWWQVQNQELLCHYKESH